MGGGRPRNDRGMSTLYTGIDLGTSNSAAAIFDGQRIAMVRNGQGSFLTPSVVRIDARGAVTVGARARRALESQPDDAAAEFKRLMGTPSRIPFRAAAVERTPIELSAEILRALRADVQDQVGACPTCAVISVPALFELPQCEATSEAARLAGFERCELIQEPIASALAAGWTAETADGSWLVYDLGGGTFDVSLLEEQEGFLRVAGHDGDNFLGGRDFDWAVVDWALAEIQRLEGIRIERSDPASRAVVRKIKLAVEEARVELSRARAASIAVDVDGAEVELTLDQALLEQLCTPLVQRSIEVCRRLLARHAHDVRHLTRVVLVGGPTVTPFLRRQVAEALQAPFGENLDPMTLVAQGAAVHAASVGLNGAPGERVDGRGRRFTLNFPPMTSDLGPTVVGRLVVAESGVAPVGVRLLRRDGWAAEDAPLDAQGAFVASVQLLPHQANEFMLLGLDGQGGTMPVQPAAVTIVHGVTVGDPPLSRTVGVATADDGVRVYFERGTALPARRTWTFKTVETLPRGAAQSVLKVPIVQGEALSAHLCRVIGAIEIGGASLPASLPLDSDVEVTLSLDRSGRLSGQALIPALGLVFEQVARLLLPEAPVEALQDTLRSHRERLQAFLDDGPPQHFEDLLRARFILEQTAVDVRAAAGGDADAAQKARRALLEVDEILDAVHGTNQWRELDCKALEWAAAAAGHVAAWGSESEKAVLEQALRRLEDARATRRLADFQTCLQAVRNLSTAAFLRRADAWELEFDYLLSRLDQSTDLARAQQLAMEGRKLRDAGDREGLRRVCREIRRLQPPDPEDRRLGHESGVR